MTETRHYKGAGGQLLHLDWPPHETVHAQITRGELRRCDVDGDPYVEPVDEPVVTLTPPAATAKKDEWVGYVVRHTEGTKNPVTIDEALAMTVQDMRERYGQ